MADGVVAALAHNTLIQNMVDGSAEPVAAFIPRGARAAHLGQSRGASGRGENGSCVFHVGGFPEMFASRGR